MRLKWVALIAALALPALAWAGNSVRCNLRCGEYCPIPCEDCPLSQR